MINCNKNKKRYDENEMGYDIQESMMEGISKSDFILVCGNSIYQSRDNCMFELRKAKEMGKQIIVLIIEENPFEWANEEMKLLCELDKKRFIDISQGFFYFFKLHFTSLHFLKF